MSLLRRFGQERLQPLLFRLARKERVRRAVAKLMPLVTVQGCDDCPALEHCLSACEGFRALHFKVNRNGG